MGRFGVFFVLSLVMTGACKGGVVTGPSPISDVTIVTLRSALDGSPVSGAVVQAGGQEVVADSSGSAAVPGLVRGSVMKITAGGFVVRDTKYSGSGGPLLLWPDLPGLIESVYSSINGYLIRWGNSDDNFRPEALLYVHEELWEDSVWQALEEAVNTANAAPTQARVRLVKEKPSPDLAFYDVMLDPTIDPTYAAATTGNRADRYGINGGTIRFRKKIYAANVAIILHELGHAVGGFGWHNPAAVGIMRTSYTPGLRDYTDLEKDMMRLVSARSTGNVRPDSDVINPFWSGAVVSYH